MIKVYSKEGCPQCVVAKNFLSQIGYAFEEVKIDKDNDAREFLLGRGHRSVPQIYVDDTPMVASVSELTSMTTKQIALRIREINGN